jgi:hypothetical protein
VIPITYKNRFCNQEIEPRKAQHRHLQSLYETMKDSTLYHKHCSEGEGAKALLGFFFGQKKSKT